MFEKFTRDARLAVVEAQEAARESGAGEISAQAVFAGLARIHDGTAVRVLGQLGVTRDEIDAELSKVRRRGGISDADAAALTEFGIDVDEIVARVEESHGLGALGRPATRMRRNHLPFTKDAKLALQMSLREAQELGDKQLGQEHLLLALVKQRGPVADFLAARGIDYPAVRHAVGNR